MRPFPRRLLVTSRCEAATKAGPQPQPTAPPSSNVVGDSSRPTGASDPWTAQATQAAGWSARTPSGKHSYRGHGAGSGPTTQAFLPSALLPGTSTLSTAEATAPPCPLHPSRGLGSGNALGERGGEPAGASRSGAPASLPAAKVSGPHGERGACPAPATGRPRPCQLSRATPQGAEVDPGAGTGSGTPFWAQRRWDLRRTAVRAGLSGGSTTARWARTQVTGLAETRHTSRAGGGGAARGHRRKARADRNAGRVQQGGKSGRPPCRTAGAGCQGSVRLADTHSLPVADADAKETSASQGQVVNKSLEHRSRRASAHAGRTDTAIPRLPGRADGGRAEGSP